MPIDHCIFAVETKSFRRGWQQGALKACNSLVNKSVTFRQNNYINKNYLKNNLSIIQMESDTKPQNVKRCSNCDETKEDDKFIKNRNICKDCRNKGSREKYKNIVVENQDNQTCNTCSRSKPISSFYKGRIICKECLNESRREKYENDEEHRQKVIRQASEFKHNKVIERQKKKLDEIGEGNKKCRYCDSIKPECKFRHNRLKCKDCERDDPLEKFKRYIRTRIYIALKGKKDMNTIEYLGCSKKEYTEWIINYDKRYTLENHGKEWHSDHVIPLSRFDLENKEQQLIAFNWRNTMPLSASENLSKNKKILSSQVEQHYKHLTDYHREKKIELPQEFIDLFARHLVVRETP